MQIEPVLHVLTIFLLLIPSLCAYYLWHLSLHLPLPARIFDCLQFALIIAIGLFTLMAIVLVGLIYSGVVY